MDILITHLEHGEELGPREIEVAAELLLDPAVADEKKSRLLLALSQKGRRPPRSLASWRHFSSMPQIP